MQRQIIYAGITSVALVAAVLAFGVWAVAPLSHPAPAVSSTRILDRNDNLLYEVARSEEGIRTVVTYDQIPPSFFKSLVAAEDSRFYRHHGIDWLAIARAAKDLVLRGQIISGASTLEQQLVKNLYFCDRPRTVIQKLREMVAARYWAANHTKEQTLELYANTVFFGNQANGVEAAARTYYHKPARDLTWGESAILVGLIPAPSQYDPYRHWIAAQKRERYVLQQLVDTGVIKTTERDEILKTELEVFPPRHDIHAPHFVFKVLDELETRFPDIRQGGYVVRTTLDPELQGVASETVTRHLLTLQDQNVTDAAVVAMDPNSGEILAYVGSADFFNERIQGQVDMAAAKRQPGSALKPFLYFEAFQRGLTPSTIIADLPVRYETAEGKPYYPRNYGYKFSGPVPIREALASSLNIPAVKVLNQLGLPAFFSTLHRFGLDFPEPPDYYGLGVVLGGGEVTLTDTVRAYGELALYGRSVTPVDVLEVRDATGKVVEQAAPAKHRPLFENQSLADQAAYLTSDVLSDKLARTRSFGEANLLDLGRKIAAKTGTTKDFRDNWAFGYTPDLALGVWVGNANNAPMQGVSGISGAVPIWHDILSHRFDRGPEIVWPRPAGIVEKEVCVTSGLLANDLCPKTKTEKFIAGTEPTKPDDWYVRLDIDAASGALATDACRARVVQKTFLQPPVEYAAWLKSAKHEAPPTRDCQGRDVTPTDDRLAILSPLDGDAFERELMIDPSGAQIPFVAGGRRATYHWTLNGQPLESTDSVYLWTPKPGEYTLSLEDADREISFSVR